jgi:hypothetical protein
MDRNRFEIGHLSAANFTVGMKAKLLIQKRTVVFSWHREQRVLSGSLPFICNPTKLPPFYAGACSTRSVFEGVVTDELRLAYSPSRNHPFPHGVQNQLSQAVEIQLFLKIPPVRFHRIGAQVQGLRDLLVRFPLR